MHRFASLCQAQVKIGTEQVNDMVSHIVIIVQNGILPAARVAGVPSAYVIPALTTDIRRFVVYLHVVLGQPFLQMLIACGNLTPGRRYFNL